VARRGGGERRDGQPERDRDRRDTQPDRDRDRDPYRDGDLGEPERESVAALKAILTKVATVVKPLGLTPEESTELVQRMYETILELDTRLAEETDDRRRSHLVSHVQGAEVRREDDVLVVDYPA
jgi:hypothetical protein